MTASLIFAMVAAFLAGIGARDQLIVARLSGHFGGSRPVLAVALACAALRSAWMTSSPSFCIFAIAAATASPQMAALGGALGGGAALAMGWMLGYSLERRVPLRKIRVAIGSITLATALVIALTARGIV